MQYGEDYYKAQMESFAKTGKASGPTAVRPTRISCGPTPAPSGAPTMIHKPETAKSPDPSPIHFRNCKQEQTGKCTCLEPEIIKSAPKTTGRKVGLETTGETPKQFYERMQACKIAKRSGVAEQVKASQKKQPKTEARPLNARQLQITKKMDEIRNKIAQEYQSMESAIRNTRSDYSAINGKVSAIMDFAKSGSDLLPKKEFDKKAESVVYHLEGDTTSMIESAKTVIKHLKSLRELNIELHELEVKRNGA